MHGNWSNLHIIVLDGSHVARCLLCTLPTNHLKPLTVAVLTLLWRLTRVPMDCKVIFKNIQVCATLCIFVVISQEKTIQNIEGFDKSSLKHAETQEKNPLPDKAS